MKMVESNKQLLNLLAIGAFLWYFLKGTSSLFFMSFKAFGIMSGIDPKLLFWANQILTVLFVCLLALVILKKVWKKVVDETLSTRKVLIVLAISILLVQILQFFHGFYVSEILINHFEVQALSYQDIVNEIDGFRLINLSFSLGETILLLLLFVKWK